MKHRSSKINMDCSNNRGSKGWNTIVKIVWVGRNGCFPSLSLPYLDPHLVTSSRGQTTSTHTSLLLTKERHLSLAWHPLKVPRDKLHKEMSFNSSGTIICKLQGTSYMQTSLYLETLSEHQDTDKPHSQAFPAGRAWE